MNIGERMNELTTVHTLYTCLDLYLEFNVMYSSALFSSNMHNFQVLQEMQRSQTSQEITEHLEITSNISMCEQYITSTGTLCTIHRSFT